MIAHNVAAAAKADDVAHQAAEDEAALLPPAPKRKKKEDARTRYAAWTEESSSITPDNELAMYLTEPIRDDTDLLAWWQVRVSFERAVATDNLNCRGVSLFRA